MTLASVTLPVTQWSPVPWATDYLVSDQGAVLSFSKYSSGPLPKLLGGRIIKGGYSRLVIKGKDWLLHRLIYTVFKGKPKHSDVMHLDGDPQNNKLSNLKDGTRLENNQMKQAHGTELTGDARWNTKYSEALIAEIKSDCASGKYTHQDIADFCGIPKSVVDDISCGKRRANG